MERTLAILKPDCVRKNLTGKVLQHIIDAGFKIVGMKMISLTPDTAGGFYDVHRERHFFTDLVVYMSSGPCIPLILEKENAIADLRTLMGATDPREAEEGTLRKLYAESKEQNIIHGSDSPESADKEISYFFSGREIVSLTR